MCDPSEVFRPPFFVFKFLGLWQTKSSTWKYRIYGLLSNVLTIQLFSFFQFLYFFHLQDIQSFTDCLSVFVTTFGECIKTFNFLYNRNNLLNLIETCKLLIKKSEYEGNKTHSRIRLHVKRATQTFYFLCISAIVTCLLSTLVPIIHRVERKLAFPIYIPFVDPKSSDLMFLIVAAYQMTPIFICSMVAAFDMLAIFFMAFAIGLIEELSVRIELIGYNCNGPDEQYKELIECMKIHQQIKLFVSGIQNHLSTFIMVQGFMSSLIICSTAFMLTLVTQT